MEFKIQLLAHQDLEKLTQLVSLFEDVFEMENFTCPDKAYLEALLLKPTFLAVVAVAGQQVIGGLTVYVLDQYYSTKPLAYIYDLAVLRDHQRKGVGKELIAFTKDYCQRKGFEEVFVQADKGDDYAIDFYRGTKPTMEEEAVHFSYVFNGRVE